MIDTSEVKYGGPLTVEQIKSRLKALDMYETSVMFSMPDEGDLTSRELMRIVTTRGKLQTMLAEAQKAAATGDREGNAAGAPST